VAAEFTERAFVLRLSGHAQLSDRLAVREMARQLGEQSGNPFTVEGLDDEDEEDVPVAGPEMSATLPPPSHIFTLISRLPSLQRSTVVVVDGLDLFAAHPRQALLYCLFDTVQSCRAKRGSRGLVVITISSRVDAINLLEKRVKSRFSHRIIPVSANRSFAAYLEIVRLRLCPAVNSSSSPDWEDQVTVISRHCLSLWAC
jgi:origin recognition complex subunit 4